MRANASSLSEIRPLGWRARAAVGSIAGARVPAITDARRSGVARTLAVAAGGPGCIVFLWVYAAIHLAHERGVDLAAAGAISAIPLFSTFVAALAVASTAAIAAAVFVRTSGRGLNATPRLLAVSVGVFAAVMVVFP